MSFLVECDINEAQHHEKKRMVVIIPTYVSASADRKMHVTD